MGEKLIQRSFKNKKTLTPGVMVISILAFEAVLVAINLWPNRNIPVLGPRLYLLGPVITLVILLSVIRLMEDISVNNLQGITNQDIPSSSVNATSMLRPIAAFLVFYTHARLIFEETAAKSNIFTTIIFYFPAWLGMGIFFSLSGFLMSSLFIQGKYNLSTDSLLDFFKKRFVRIAPLSILVSLLVFTLYFKNNMSPSVIFRVLFFQYNGDLGPDPIKPQWSLTTEIQFYLIFPLVFLFFLFLSNHVIHKYLIMIILMCGASLRFLIFGLLDFDITSWSSHLYVPLYGNLDLFLIGAAVPFIKRESYLSKMTIRRNQLLLVASTLMYLSYSTLTYFSMDFGIQKLQSMFVILGPSIICFFMVQILMLMGDMDITRLPDFLRRCVLFAANLTFPFYLLHVGILISLKNLGVSGPFNWILILSMGITAIFSYFLLLLSNLLKLEKIGSLVFRKTIRFWVFLKNSPRN